MSLGKAPFGFAPTSITGCQLWLDGADSSSASMTFSSGSNISVWKDKSGSANNATAVGVPTYGTNTVVMGGSAYFTISGISANSSNEAFFMVVNWSSSGAEQPFFIGTTLNGGRCLFISPGSTTLVGSSYNVGNTSIGPNGGTPANTIIMVELMTSSLVNTVYTNGQNAGSPVSASYSGGGTSVLGVGFNGGAPRATQYLTGNIYEVVMYNTAITNTQRQQVESYLAQKWGITASLPGGHPGLTTTVFKADYIKNSAIIRSVAKPIPYFTTFSPIQIPGCSLWMDGADSSTITTVTGVSQWNDKSGNGYNLTQGSTGSQPTRTENLLNFLSNNYLNIPQAAVNNLSTWSIFFVINPISSTNWIMVKQKNGVNTFNVLSMTSNTNSGGGPQTGSTGFLYWRSFNAGSQLASTGEITTSTLQIGNLTYDGTNLYFYKNGVLEKTTAGSFAIPNDTSSTNYTMGIWIQDGTIINSGVTNFRLGEMLVYNTGLATTQRQQVESYLAQKWGLTASLPGGHLHLTQRAGAITTVANTKFSMVGVPRITFASTGLVITHQDGRTWKATANNPGYANYAIGLNSGASMSLNIYAGSDVFNSAGGRVALLYNGDTNNAVRHAGYVMWTSTFAANNYDFGWKFVSSGSGYLIYNDYPSIGSAWQVTYDSGADRVLIQPPGAATYGMVWNITPKVTLAYVYSSY